MQEFYNAHIGNAFGNSIQALQGNRGVEGYDPETSLYGIAGNTFRAFRGFVAPSATYRTWAARVTQDVMENTPVINTQIDFSAWHQQLFESLQGHWTNHYEMIPSIAHSYKMIDLYIKWLYSCNACPEQLSVALESYAHCALDSKILEKLNEALSYALPVISPSMRNVINSNTYVFCQSLIRDFSNHFGGTSLLFDFYAWSE